MKLALTSFFLLATNVAWSQNHQAALQDYLTDDVAAVAYLDLSQIDTLAALEWADKLGLGPTAEQRGQATRSFLQVQALLDQYAEFGARYVYALFRVSDVTHKGPTWLVPIETEGDPRAVMGLILSGRPDRFDVEQDMRPGFLPEHCEVFDNAVLGANSPEQLEMLKKSRPAKPRDLADAWSSLGSGHCGMIVFGDENSRRVVREVFPQLPEPLSLIDGRFLADRIVWFGAVAELPPQPSFQLLAQTDDPRSAAQLRDTLSAGLAVLENMPIARQTLSSEDRAALTAALEPVVADDQVIMSMKDVFADSDRIARMLAPPIRKTLQDTQRRSRVNKYKQIALAMLNYESANKCYPPRCSVSEDGKPLLSWRVHILPYLEQGALYDRFHLDEPWDSEHNKQLIPLMPEVYADPDPALADRNAQGRTTFVVPTGPGTVFESMEGTPIKDVTDGTSNTILLIEVKPSAAPVWTRPRDWTPSAVPYEMLRRDDRDWITAGYCDGHVQILPLSTPIEKLRALITRAGGEVIKWP